MYCTYVLDTRARSRVSFHACATYVRAYSLEKTRRAHPHYRARKTGRCSFRTAIIYPGVTDWSLERGRDNARGRRRNGGSYVRVCVRVCVRSTLPSLKRLGWHPPAFLCGSTWISLFERLSLTSLARYRYVILLQLADVDGVLHVCQQNVSSSRAS